MQRCAPMQSDAGVFYTENKVAGSITNFQGNHI